MGGPWSIKEGGQLKQPDRGDHIKGLKLRHFDAYCGRRSTRSAAVGVEAPQYTRLSSLCTAAAAVHEAPQYTKLSSLCTAQQTIYYGRSELAEKPQFDAFYTVPWQSL